jgi:hypothetical protein
MKISVTGGSGFIGSHLCRHGRFDFPEKSDIIDYIRLNPSALFGPVIKSTEITVNG